MICAIIVFSCIIGILAMNYSSHRSDAVDDIEKWNEQEEQKAA